MTFPSFSRGGLGVALASIFERRFGEQLPLLLQGERGRQLFILCDIGGSLREQPFETFSFLVIDLDRSEAWFHGQQVFRTHILAQRRRMAFKALNDALRRKALLPFLEMAEMLTGVLVTFAVHKRERPILGDGGATREELSNFWKPSIVDRLMWVVHLGAFLVSGFAAPGQDVTLILDEDDVAANVPQLTKLTELFARATSNPNGPMKGHLRCGTTKSEDGTLRLEDLAALPDLAAGATAEFVTALTSKGLGALSPLIQRLPSAVSWKTRIIVPWAVSAGVSLDRLVCLIDGVSGSSKWRATIPQWFEVENPVFQGNS